MYHSHISRFLCEIEKNCQQFVYFGYSYGINQSTESTRNTNKKQLKRNKIWTDYKSTKSIITILLTFCNNILVSQPKYKYTAYQKVTYTC